MISKFLITLNAGFKTMLSNTKMLFVGVLVFVFPILFFWITQSFFTTAYNNINTSEKNVVSILHDSLSSQLLHNKPDSENISELIEMYKQENQTISKIKIVNEAEGQFRVVNAVDSDSIGTIVTSDQLYRDLPFSAEDNSFIVETTINGVRTWQAFRSVHTKENDFIIFTEHKFALIDSVMLARRQQSYFGLTAIFLFLIALAYWLNKQTYWHKKYTVLETRLKERDLFSNMIAHEFRTPLTAIKGYASLLEEDKHLNKDSFRFAKSIHISADRLVLLVNDFLQVARLQSGKIQIKIEEINLHSVLKNVIQDLQELASKKNLKLELEQTKEFIPFKTDKNRMTQVLTNIITNSLKYTDSGTVTVECKEKKGEIVIYVKDTGTGISAEDQQKIFEPFSRVGNVDSTKIVGTGLGMWITKQLVTLLDGNIGVESIKGVGTHVVISFEVED